MKNLINPNKLIEYSLVVLCLFSLYYISEGTLCNEQSHCVPLAECPLIYAMMKRSNLTAAERNFIRRSICNRELRSVCCPTDIPKASECGVYFLKPDRIFGGETTSLEEFPWTVLIKRKHGTFKNQLCGGSLINKRYILTAAHCIKYKDDETFKIIDIPIESVLLGEWNKATVKDCENATCSDPTVEVKVEKVIVHEDYAAEGDSPDDIALLRLAKEVDYTKYIQPICLPLQDILKNNLFEESTSFTVVGWGKTEKTEFTSDEKLKATIPSYNRRKCKRIYRYDFGATIGDKQICAGGETNIDTCRGDSGGPLMALDFENMEKPRYYVAGIVSFGPFPCAKSGTPGIYTRVGAYVDWILKNIEP